MLTVNLPHLQIQEAARRRRAGKACQRLGQMLLRFSMTAANESLSNLTCILESQERWLQDPSRDGTLERAIWIQSERHGGLTSLCFQLPACYWKCNWTFSPRLSNGIVFNCPICLEKWFQKINIQNTEVTQRNDAGKLRASYSYKSSPDIFNDSQRQSVRVNCHGK